MTVKDLIAKLQKLDLEKEILIQNRDGDVFSYGIDNIISAYVDDMGSTILEVDGEITPEDYLDLNEEDSEFIEQNEYCYIITPC